MAKRKNLVCQASISARALALLIRMAEIIDTAMHETRMKLALAPRKDISLFVL